MLMPLVGTCSLGVGEFNSHLRLGVQKLSAIDDESRVEINIYIYLIYLLLISCLRHCAFKALKSQKKIYHLWHLSSCLQWKSE